jgi:hypothetical protein
MPDRADTWHIPSYNRVERRIRDVFRKIAIREGDVGGPGCRGPLSGVPYCLLIVLDTDYGAARSHHLGKQHANISSSRPEVDNAHTRLNAGFDKEAPRHWLHDLSLSGEARILLRRAAKCVVLMRNAHESLRLTVECSNRL